MATEEILFITHKTFTDEGSAEGGVKYCTLEYIEMLGTGYKVNVLKVDYNKSWSYRVKSKLGIDAYEEYDPAASHDKLAAYINEHKVNKIFLNLSNASQFAEYIKKKFSNGNVKVILCSHGNESGDFLHQSVRFKKTMPFFKRIFSAYRLGLILKKELNYRLHYFDLVLTVSEIEKNLEYWLGAKKVYMIPRVLKNQFLSWQPEKQSAGFIGDLSHYPNYFGLSELCSALSEMRGAAHLKIYVAGHKNKNLTALAQQYKFIYPLGYLDNVLLEKEAARWNYFLNPVFYYSKGVSTKLEKGMNWGLPVLSTPAGNRGYEFGQNKIPTYNTPAEMANALFSKMSDTSTVVEDKLIVENAITTCPGYEKHINSIKKLLEEN